MVSNMQRQEAALTAKKYLLVRISFVGSWVYVPNRSCFSGHANLWCIQRQVNCFSLAFHLHEGSDWIRNFTPSSERKAPYQRQSGWVKLSGLVKLTRLSIDLIGWCGKNVNDVYFPILHYALKNRVQKPHIKRISANGNSRSHWKQLE